MCIRDRLQTHITNFSKHGQCEQPNYNNRSFVSHKRDLSENRNKTQQDQNFSSQSQSFFDFQQFDNQFKNTNANVSNAYFEDTFSQKNPNFQQISCFNEPCQEIGEKSYANSNFYENNNNQSVNLSLSRQVQNSQHENGREKIDYPEEVLNSCLSSVDQDQNPQSCRIYSYNQMIAQFFGTLKEQILYHQEIDKIKREINTYEKDLNMQSLFLQVSEGNKLLTKQKFTKSLFYIFEIDTKVYNVELLMLRYAKGLEMRFTDFQQIFAYNKYKIQPIKSNHNTCLLYTSPSPRDQA
eukprot:TRINITY_DN7704_c0_g1_i4.p1 TRINITY_DN7704_c0_g1~~TRINITY_DN7704_c0_g1_i4.p1  ORF type:complete len:295 (-),score=39.27 TRINITY_DN7704_c0_g1_i4:157-1041(-)